MARHYKLPGLMTPAEKMARVAADAQTVARRALTRRSGTIVVQNEDGSKTVIGPGAGTDATGSPTGVAEWVGDTIPPGKPAGVSATSSWGTVYLKWDGTLEGGVPADFAYVSVAVGGTEAGRMSEAGVLALDGYEDGTVLDVAFTAWDAARDADGAPAPNASEPTVVRVTVVDERAEIDAEVSQAREDAADALASAQQTATDAAAGVQEAKDAAQAAKDAADDAKATADGYQQQITEVTTKVGGIETDVSELSAEVSGAVEDAAGALSAATKAQQDLAGFKTEASQTYQPKGDYATSTDLRSYATKSELSQTASGLSASVEAATETAEGALAQATEAVQTATGVKTTLETDYVSKADASETYASKAELSATSSSLSARVEEAATAADAAQRKALEVEATADGLSATVSQVSTVASQAKSAADTASTAAGKAQSTADSAVKQVTSLSATVDGIETSVATAQETADSAVEAASAAQQSVDGFKQTVSQTYATKTSVSAVEGKADAAQGAADGAQADLDAYKGTVTKTYATKTELSQTADGIRSEVSETYQTKAGMSAYATSSSVEQTAESIMSEVATEYQTKDGMSSYATKSYVDQQDGSITSTVSEVQTTADSALTKATQVEQTASGLSVRLTQAEEDVDAAQSAANSASSAASAAQSTANQAQSAASTAQSTADTARDEASDAAKTATNYLKFDSSGLCVGDQTAGSLGMNALVAASKISLRSGSTELATFSPTLIELGRNSQSSKIQMCGGRGLIGTSNGGVVFGSSTSTRVALTSEAQQIVNGSWFDDLPRVEVSTGEGGSAIDVTADTLNFYQSDVGGCDLSWILRHLVRVWTDSATVSVPAMSTKDVSFTPSGLEGGTLAVIPVIGSISATTTAYGNLSLNVVSRTYTNVKIRIHNASSRDCSPTIRVWCFCIGQ